MASIGNALVSKILGHSAAEKAFRPWWDTVEDFLIYGLVMLGLMVLPTAIISGTPLDCTFCESTYCDGKEFIKYGDEVRFEINYTTVDPEFNAWWVKKYCTVNSLDEFTMYFPYILLIIPVVIVLIERVFIRIFKAGIKLDIFYNLLVKETLEDDDPGKADEVDGAKFTRTSSVEFKRNAENSKTAIEVSQSFAENSNYFFSYLIRTTIELILAVFLLVFLCYFGVSTMQNDEFIYCLVHGFRYECTGHPQQFYLYVLFTAIVFLCVYVLCCLWNILWLAFPNLRTLGRMMHRYKQVKKQNEEKDLRTDEELLGDLHEIYYSNSDLKLLLDLLAESSGIAPSIRILALFDKEFRVQAEAQEVQVEREPDAATVQFAEPDVMMKVFSKIKGVRCIYTVEISPPTPESSVFMFRCNATNAAAACRTKSVQVNDDEAEMMPLKADAASKRAKFTKLDPNKDYTVRVCTVMNGKAIAGKIIKIEKL